MPPLYDFICNSCGHQFEEFIKHYTYDNEISCPHCEVKNTARLPSAPGGYYIQGANGSSVRPKNAGSFKKKNV